MSIIMGSVLLYIHVTNRQPKTDKPGLGFWLIVGLPLVVMFSLRLPFPDVCYDQMSYHMVNSERALWGWPFKSGEFFPGVLQTNPAPDMVTGISHLLLGYRLGPVINLRAVLWAAVIFPSGLYYPKNHAAPVGAICCLNRKHFLSTQLVYDRSFGATTDY